MAASLAAAIRGQEVITDAQVLKMVAASELDVGSLEFNQVVHILDSVGFVHTVQTSGTKITSFAESVPYHESLYQLLGQAWEDADPTPLERAFVSTIDRLARGVVLSEDLSREAGVDPTLTDEVLELGAATALVRPINLPDGQLLYSPFMGFEHPDVMGEVLGEHGPARLQEELDQVRRHQGLPINASENPGLMAAVASGLIAAPTVQRPDQFMQSFACLPYAPDPTLFAARRTVLDKALAIVASVRCGQYFGGATPIRDPLAILRKLLEPNHTLTAHSSARRQYQPLFRLQIVDFIPSGSWVQPKLIATEDNVASVRLAIDLLKHGEAITDRAGETDARQMLMTGGYYLPPIRALQTRRRTLQLDDAHFEKAMGVLMGRAPL
ncbi:MAG: hypothetical protein ACYCZN_04585 [Candidatus Dormibacteria bacterium]